MTSTKPYLLRALHEWCTDNGLTPYIAVAVDDSVEVPVHVVSDGEVVLNISYDATGGLQIGNDRITFKARFGGVAQDISVPVTRILAIYARENGEGMAFPVLGEKERQTTKGDGSTSLQSPRPVPNLSLVPSEAISAPAPDEDPPPNNSSPNSRTLRRIK
jgi:stringent starvation protein B